MDWSGVDYLWCFYQLFGLSFWRHPFTAEDPLVSKWCNATFLQIKNSSTSWMRVSKFQQIWIFGWSIPLKITKIIILSALHYGIHYSMKCPPAIYCNVSDSSMVLYTAFDVSRYQVKSRFSYTSSASSDPSWGVRGSQGIVKQVNLQYGSTRAAEIKHWACACEMRARCHQVLHSWTERQQNIYQPSVTSVSSVCACVRERESVISSEPNTWRMFWMDDDCCTHAKL